MSECVVRMKKYGNCLDCDLHQIVYGDSYADTDVYCFKEKRLVGKRFGPAKDLARPDWCPIICQLPEGRSGLVDVWQDVTTLLCALEGKAPEMTDKDAIKVISRAEWLILNQIVRGIDKEAQGNGEQ